MQGYELGVKHQRVNGLVLLSNFKVMGDRVKKESIKENKMKYVIK